MTQVLRISDIRDRSDKSSEQPVLFLDWPLDVGLYPSGSIFDEGKFNQKGLIFFDPYHFALTYNLRSQNKENFEVEYISFDKQEFLLFLKNAKMAKERIQSLLINDGILVIRSNIPQIHIKVRKKSSAAVKKYTESIISAFFWLDEILGQYSFYSCNARSLTYRSKEHPFARVFGNCRIACFQTQNVISRGEVSVIAVGSISRKSPLITRVSYHPQPGQVFFIPQFLVKDEHKKLCQVFKLLAESEIDDFKKPTWLKYYEDQIKSYSPHRPKMERIDLEIRALVKQKAILDKLDSDVDKLPGLLHERGDRLRDAITVALATLGFDVARTIGNPSDNMLMANYSKGSNQKLIIKISQPSIEPTPPERIEELSEMMATYSSMVQVKGFLIGNGSGNLPPEKRSDWFDKNVVESGRERGYCLMPTLDLFVAAWTTLSRAESQNIEKIKTSLRKDIIDCIGLFEINRKKYGI